MIPARVTVLLLAVLLLGSRLALTTPRAEVKLLATFSANPYDPSRPSQATFKCVLRNEGSYPLHVPVGYDDNYIRIASGQLRLMKFPAKKGDVRLEWLEPDHEVVVFDLPLEEMFAIRREEFPMRWTWDRRSESPHSPIHRYRMPGFYEKASFSVTINLGQELVRSDPIVLNIKPSDPPPSEPEP